jgi:hypothetical protein
MRTREGIEPRDEQRTVDADMLSNMEGSIRGAEGQGPREPTGVEDRGTSPRQSRELRRSKGFLQDGSRAVQPAHREDARWSLGSRMPPYERGRGGARRAKGGTWERGLEGHVGHTQRWNHGDYRRRVHRQTSAQGTRGDLYGPDAPRWVICWVSSTHRYKYWRSVPYSTSQASFWPAP